METRFLELEEQLRGARLDYQGGAAGEYWRVAASFDRLARSRFEAISKLAGRKLLADAGDESGLPAGLQHAPDDGTRWYRAMKLQSGHYEHGFVGFQTNEDGSDAGSITTGHIYSPAAVAATLCLELSTMKNEASTPAGPLTIHVGGVNTRVNLHSNDNSTNTYIASEVTVFENLRSIVAEHAPAELKAEFLERIQSMEQSVGKPTFTSRYNDFIQSAANHIAIFTPLLPALSALLPT
ncbi:MAG: hypothetical protein HWD57_19275 [Candidatus Accumulibacter cognatus]|uniref:Uncharacterized protein n=1 Tax=Candidatus Accumulibacter cognatus TaxID=2954383 RepID=A0A7D5SH05_9PROT|nr:MAG: hypothetical protein HWD57_19275 [Candidatus Accumulibacter cognatus]